MATGMRRLLLVTGLTLSLLASLSGLLPGATQAADACMTKGCITLKPDLSVSVIEEIPDESGAIFIKATVRNTAFRGVNAGAFRVALVDSQGLIYDVKSVSSLSAGASTSVWFILTWGDAGKAFRVIVDSANQVQESNETNNTASFVL